MPRSTPCLLFIGGWIACTSTSPSTGPVSEAPPAPQAPPAASATELAAQIRAGRLTAEAAVQAYLARIEALDDQGPTLQAVLAVNPNVLDEARILDAEAQSGQFRGPLHGVPVLVKDNIETKELPTTAGSLALSRNQTGRDAPIIERLRAQGALILGKTNLSEWANFRSRQSISGWSGIGGQTKNPHSLDRTPCGSSAGSAAAVAAQLAPLALGTETNGSIICPSSMTGIVGFKPTVGLLSRRHIVPLSSTQDTAGPMARTVADAALMLTAMAGTDPQDPVTAEADTRKVDFTAGLTEGVQGMRIGVFRWAEGNVPAVSRAFSEAVEVLRAQGAELVDIPSFAPSAAFNGGAIQVLETEFKATLNAYLQTAAPEVTSRSLAELIAYNETNAERELVLFDQSLFVTSQARNGLDDPGYLAARAGILQGARDDGIDHLLEAHNVQVLIMPSAGPAFFVDVVFGDRDPGQNVGAGWLSAIAGYPIVTVPMGEHRGLPIGLSVTATAYDDARVLAVAHAYEQAAAKMVTPTYAAGPFAHPTTEAALRPYAGTPE